MRLKDKKIFIVGGSSGIGASLVGRCINEGAQVFFENKEGTLEVAARTQGMAKYTQLSLSDYKSIEKVVEQAYSAIGSIDILINNAGRYIDGDEWDGEYHIWEKTIKEDLLGIMEVTKHVAKRFVSEQKGVIVNVASRMGVVGSFEEIAYSAAKAGLINQAQAYAQLLSPFGRANSVSPHATKAGYWLRAPEESRIRNTTMGRLVEVEEVVNAIVFLASEEASMITGQNIIVGPVDVNKK